MLINIIENLGEPRDFWEYFKKISEIPRCTGNEKDITNFICLEVNKFGFKYKKDDVGNLLVFLPSINKSNIKVIGQCHLDMVCEKNANVKHDFLKDPIKFKLEQSKSEKWLKAEGTTLGADNGVGIALLLTLMKKIYEKQINFYHLSMNLLFTVKEEIGLVGVSEMDPKLINGDFLINLDTGEEGKLIVGCAGGIKTIAEKKINYMNVDKYEKDNIAMSISIKGLKGGHSGSNIHLPRGNAIKILSYLLWQITKKQPIYINSIAGGDKGNAIPREAKAIIYISQKSLNAIKRLVEGFVLDLNSEPSIQEPEMEISIYKMENFIDKKILSPSFQERLLQMLLVFPNGVVMMHPEIVNLTHSSTNLASVKIEKNFVSIVSTQRSMNEVMKQKIMDELEALFTLADPDFKIQFIGDYPAWELNFNSTLLKVARDLYHNLFNKEAVVGGTHGGLECAIFKKLEPKLEIISMGPTIMFPHSPDESLKISSVKRIWELFIKILQYLDEKLLDT